MMPMSQRLSMMWKLMTSGTPYGKPPTWIDAEKKVMHTHEYNAVERAMARLSADRDRTSTYHGETKRSVVREWAMNDLLSRRLPCSEWKLNFSLEVLVGKLKGVL